MRGFARVPMAGAGVLVAGLWSLAARAEEPALEGTWAMSPITEAFVVQQWGVPCGPAPVTGALLAGESVAIHDDHGELRIVGEHRTLRTDECLDPMPTMSRETHSHDARSWRTRCATPARDPRHAVVNTAFFIAPGDDAISVAETGRYEFAVAGERCVADVKRSGLFSRMPGAALAGQGGRKAAGGPLRADCTSPGDPERLEVRPSRKLLTLGQSFGFQGVVVDANGCATGTPITWAIGPVTFRDGQPHGGKPAIDGLGRLAIPGDDFSDATFDVVAMAAGHGARASVEATSASNYEALLAQSGLDAHGERVEPSIAVLATSSIGATRTRAEDGASRRRNVFIAIVGGLALILGAVAVIGARRARSANRAQRDAQARHAAKMQDFEAQKQQREQHYAEQMRAHVQSVAIAQQQAAAAAARGIDGGPAFCPSCRREFDRAGAFCPYDANRLVTIAGHEDLLAGPAGGVCPACKRGFNPGVRVCPHDGEELVPPSIVDATRAPSHPARGKICPTCGGRFEGNAAFCGKDGTQLVLLN